MSDADDATAALAAPRGLAELHPEDQRTCASCRGAVARATYFANDYYCDPCAAHANDYPWQTTAGGIAP